MYTYMEVAKLHEGDWRVVKREREKRKESENESESVKGGRERD